MGAYNKVNGHKDLRSKLCAKLIEWVFIVMAGWYKFCFVCKVQKDIVAGKLNQKRNRGRLEK